jgi:hypothetical protein
MFNNDDFGRREPQQTLTMEEIFHKYLPSRYIAPITN